MPWDTLMAQAGKVQQQMQDMQRKLELIQETGNAGAGLVQVTLNGKFETVTVSIDPTALSHPKNVLEELITSAFNDAVQKIQKRSMREMSHFANLFQTKESNQES